MEKIASRQRGDVWDTETLTRLARGIAASHAGEIGCDECFEQLDEFADTTLSGKNAAQALPGVENHLQRCADCREEFEALMRALRGVA
jgi:hypothetical protein